MKIVINKCFGGFSVSDDAVRRLGLKSRYSGIERTNPHLVALVEEDAEKTSGSYAELEVVEIPDIATDWELDEYDGYESITYVVGGKLYHI